MALMVMVSMIMVVAFVIVIMILAGLSLSRFRLKVAFDYVGRTQRFAFQARRSEPIKLTLGRFRAASHLFQPLSRSSSRT